MQSMDSKAVEEWVRGNIFRIRYFLPVCLLPTLCFLGGLFSGAIMWIGIMISVYIPGIVVSERFFASLDIIERDLLILPSGFGFYTVLSYLLGIFDIPFMNPYIITLSTLCILIIHYHKEVRGLGKKISRKEYQS